MGRKNLLLRSLYLARDWRSRALFAALREHTRGRVLDVGGWDFFLSARAKGVPFESWTALEPSTDRSPTIDDPRFHLARGDGCNMEFHDSSFDTVLAVQVLEHVFEPIRMVSEIGRVLRPGGCAILLVPQTGNMHFAPNWYGNLSRYWIEEAVARAGLEIMVLQPLGGFWSSTASRFFYFFLQSARVEGMSAPECRRGPLFYVLWPVMALFALLAISLCLLLSLGDLAEEPNNHLVVASKR